MTEAPGAFEVLETDSTNSKQNARRFRVSKGTVSAESRAPQSRSEGSPLSVAVAKLAALVLPDGFPASVTADYLPYQLWDTVQACCSYVRGMLSQEAILRGLGVGRSSASVVSAVGSVVLRQTASITASLFFTFFQGSNLDANAKQWRLVADVLNSGGLFLELLSPVAPGGFAACATAGAVALAITGVAGGASRAALTRHFATGRAVGDLSAKEGSQEALTNLVGMLLGFIVIKMSTSFPSLPWVLFALLTAAHLAANVAAVRALHLTTLNTYRLHELVARSVHRGFTHTPDAPAAPDVGADDWQTVSHKDIDAAIAEPPVATAEHAGEAAPELGGRRADRDAAGAGAGAGAELRPRAAAAVVESQRDVTSDASACEFTPQRPGPCRHARCTGAPVHGATSYSPAAVNASEPLLTPGLLSRLWPDTARRAGAHVHVGASLWELLRSKCGVVAWPGAAAAGPAGSVAKGAAALLKGWSRRRGAGGGPDQTANVTEGAAEAMLCSYLCEHGVALVASMRETKTQSAPADAQQQARLGTVQLDVVVSSAATPATVVRAAAVACVWNIAFHGCASGWKVGVRGSGSVQPVDISHVRACAAGQGGGGGGAMLLPAVPLGSQLVLQCSEYGSAVWDPDSFLGAARAAGWETDALLGKVDSTVSVARVPSKQE